MRTEAGILTRGDELAPSDTVLRNERRRTELFLVESDTNSSSSPLHHLREAHPYTETAALLSQRASFRIEQNKLLDYSLATDEIAKLRSRGKKVIYIDGVFDLLHSGHLEKCRQARLEGDVLVIGIKPDSMVKRMKGENRPIRPQSERQLVLAGLEAVDYVTILPDIEELSVPEWRIQILKHLSPSAYAIMKGDENQADKAEYVGAIPGTSLVLLEGMPKTQSTTSIVQKILASSPA